MPSKMEFLSSTLALQRTPLITQFMGHGLSELENSPPRNVSHSLTQSF